jgi:hypothetical protein
VEWWQALGLSLAGGGLSGYVYVRVRLATLQIQVDLLKSRYESELGRGGTLQRVENRLEHRIEELERRRP